MMGCRELYNIDHCPVYAVDCGDGPRVCETELLSIVCLSVPCVLFLMYRPVGQPSKGTDKKTVYNRRPLNPTVYMS